MEGHSLAKIVAVLQEKFQVYAEEHPSPWVGMLDDKGYLCCVSM